MKMKQLVGILMGLILISGMSLVSAQDQTYELELSFNNLADPGEDHYEGWLIVDGSPISTGKFTLDNGNIVSLDGEAIDSFEVSVDISKATKFVLTLEPKGDTDEKPAAIKPVAGTLNEDKTSASLSHNIGADFSSIAGDYILATPSNGANTSENSGIWFLDPTGDNVTASLDLPDLTNTNWIYEGWVVIDGTPVTSGRFNHSSQADDMAPYSGTQGSPPFPGEDYLNNEPSGLSFPTDLAGQKAVISVEPKQDNSPAPFQFKPLAGDIPSDATDHKLYSMNDVSSSLASGSLDISKEIDGEADENGLPGFYLLSSVLLLTTMTVIIRKSRAE